MRHPVMISVTFLCVLLLPGVVLAQTEADLEAEAKADREWGGREKRLEALRQMRERSRKQEEEMLNRRVFSPRYLFGVPTYWDTEEAKKALEDLKKQAREEREDPFLAKMEAWGLADKKPPLSVPLSADGITQIRVRRAPGLGVASYGSCTQTNSGVSSNLDLSEIVAVLEKLCDAIQDVGRNIVDKVSELPSEYDLFLSLKKPLMGVSVLRWQASTLDDALTIVRSVQEGRLEAAMIRTHQPKKEPEPDSKPIKYELEPCKECHVKEWVFRVSGKK